MHRRRLQAIILLAILIPLLWSFGCTLTGSRICGYRDTAHFYYPLYAWTARCWGSGEIPLWNPQENIGTPIAAEATSAVFYPGQLLFALPLPYSLRFNLYVLAHFLLAAAGAYLLARHLLVREASPRTSDVDGQDISQHDAPAADLLHRPSAALCSLAYAFGGAVLFQYCNIVFLVGAAWLPFALLAADCMLTTRRFTWAVGLGAALALMVLGGDPQMAYHTGLLAALLAWLRRRRRSTKGDGAATPGNSALTTQHALPTHRRQHALLLLLSAACVGVLLSAVQIAPSLAWVRTSQRATEERVGREETPFLGKPADNSHAERLYDFSVAPWRVLECLWPNVSGQMFPINRRWLSALRAEDRVWTPTLYLGLLPFLLALSMWPLRTGDQHVRWLRLVMMGALLASFGWYGVGWLAGELKCLWTGSYPTHGVHEPVGGIYWMMVQVLPGYSYFRYPAKLLVIASLATALLGGLGLERALRLHRIRFCHIVVGIGTLSLLACIAFAGCGLQLSEWFSDAPPDDLFGPLDVQGAWHGCMFACAHTTLLCGLFWWLLRRPDGSPVRLANVLVVITAVEIAWANGANVMTVPTVTMEAPAVLQNHQPLSADASAPFAGGAQPKEPTHPPVTRVYRPRRRQWVPPPWKTESDPDRGEQVVRWDRATLFPKYHLLGSYGSVQTFNTLAQRDYHELLESSSENFVHPEILNLLGVQYAVLPANEQWPLTPFYQPRAKLAAESTQIDTVDNVIVWQNSAEAPRAWIVHAVDYPRQVASEGETAPAREPLAFLYPWHRSAVSDLRGSAVVKSSTRPAVSEPDDASNESCRVTKEHVGCVEVDAILAAPGLLVLCNQYDAGWSVQVTTNGTTTSSQVERTNGIMQGVFLPAGQHQLKFRYRPPGFYGTATASLLGWFACGALAIQCFKLRRRSFRLRRA